MVRLFYWKLYNSILQKLFYLFRLLNQFKIFWQSQSIKFTTLWWPNEVRFKRTVEYVYIFIILEKYKTTTVTQIDRGIFKKGIRSSFRHRSSARKSADVSFLQRFRWQGGFVIYIYIASLPRAKALFCSSPSGFFCPKDQIASSFQ